MPRSWQSAWLKERVQRWQIILSRWSTPKVSAVWAHPVMGSTHSCMQQVLAKCQAVLLVLLTWHWVKTDAIPALTELTIYSERPKKKKKKLIFSILSPNLVVHVYWRKWSRWQSHWPPRPNMTGKHQPPPFSLPMRTPKKPRSPHIFTSVPYQQASVNSINNLPNK